MDTSRRWCTKLTFIGYLIRDNYSSIITAKNKNIGDCPILVKECLALWEVVIMAIHNRIKRIIVQSDSLLVVNSTNVKTRAPKDIVNLIEDVKYLSDHFSDSKL